MVNWDRISELREEVGEDDLAEVLLLFCEEVEEVLAKLPSAAPGELAGHLHFLKGSALNIGLDEVSTLCRVEEERLATDTDGCPQLDAIRVAYDAAHSEIEALL